MRERNNTLVVNSKDIDVVMLIKKLIEWSDSHSETSRSIRQHSKDEPVLTDVVSFLALLVINFCKTLHSKFVWRILFDYWEKYCDVNICNM